MSTLSIGSVGVTVTSILNPGFRGIPNAGAVVKYLLNAMITIKRYDLPVRIYLTKDVSERIGNMLTAMGIKFRLVSVDKMTPPYIYIYARDRYFVIKTVDEGGKDVAEFQVLSTKFIEELQTIITRKREGTRQRKKKENDEIEELVINSDFLNYIKKIEEFSQTDGREGVDHE
ncbi:MAG: hypothetical protein QXE75_05025 [Sulfolobales archaeon]